ncbi:MAG: hypothetical protein KAR44_07455 [Candidatus Aegiribacteria sp.]|nr:hypothetical protein [Candidatus Aegiribacteria sp.]
MKYFLVSVVILLLGCSMPGVGELEERVDELEDVTIYDDSDIVEQVYRLEEDIEIIDERVSALELGGVAEIREISMPDPDLEDEVEPEVLEPLILTIEDIDGLQDSLDLLNTNFSDSITVLDESIELLVLSMDSLTMENDSLRADLEDLQDTVANLSYTVENMRYTGTEGGSTRGGSGTSSGTSTGGRGTSGTTGTTGGTTGGTTSGGR